jgi:hypothetical protein
MTRTQLAEGLIRPRARIRLTFFHYVVGLPRFIVEHSSRAHEGLRLARQARVELTIAIALQHLALLAELGGDVRRAAQLLGYVDAQYAALGTEHQPTEQ